MRGKRTLPALLLTAAMLLSMVTPAWAVEESERAANEPSAGSVQATVRLDYEQTLKELEQREVKAELLQGNTSIGAIALTEAAETKMGNYTVEVAHRDATGGELDSASSPKALDLTVTGLPNGNYTLRFTGTGYVECSVPFTMDSYNKYIEVGTGDSTFTLGDFDGNKKVNETDRDALSKVLGTAKQEELEAYDLNGDGPVDIIDLAYVNRNVIAFSSKADAVVLDTACYDVHLDAAAMRKELEGSKTEIVDGDSLYDLLRDDGNAVTFKNASGDIVIPVPLEKEVETETLQITTPSTSGTIQKGKVEVEYMEGDKNILQTKVIPFGETVPEGVHAITRTPGSNVITINLGKRVAVKKVTITVTKTAGGDYATVESIQFLKDIAPEGLVEPNSQVKRLSAEAGDGLVNLTWPELPNVSGYRVDYWEEGKESDARQLSVDVNAATVTGLENLKYYQFTVTPTDGTWEGRACDPVTAMPQPTKVPSPPDMVNVTALDGKLAVSWKKGENVTYFEVYYTDKQDAELSSYQQYGGKLEDPSLTMEGLTNDTTYYIYVVAGNDVGKSGPSRIASGTPKAVKYERPEGIPTEGILNSEKIKSVALADPNNVNTSEYTTEAPFAARNVVDNNYRTHWTARNWSSNEHIVVEFTGPVDLYCAIWVPRLDGNYPNYLRAYSVQVWYEGEDLTKAGHLLTGGQDSGGTSNADVWSWPNIPNRGQIPTSKFAIMPFDTAKRVVKISIAAEQAGYNIVSCSELMFLEYDEKHCLPDQIAKLFADPLYTKLASGVTQAQIDALKQRLDEERNYYLNPNTLADELALAQELLEDQKTKGVVLDGVRAPAGTETHGQGGSDLQPLGAAAKAGQEITIYASGIPDGKSIPIYATQYNAEVSAWKEQVGEVKNGRNILIVPKIGSQNTERGGSLYYTYSGTAAEAAGIKLHVRRAVDIPMLELSDWYKIDETVRRSRIDDYIKELSDYVTAQGINGTNAATKITNVTEISMPSVLLSIPAAAVNGKSADALYNNVLAWEDVMHICKSTQGIDNTYDQNDMNTRQNIRCMQMFAGAFMYAAGNHIGIGYGSCSGVVSGTPISKMADGAAANSLFGWGIAHEIGHNMDKLGKAEITNNIYSLMVQTYDGKDNTLASRLEKSGKYPAIFNKAAQGYPGASNDVFVQLGMYWQLHLAYDGAKTDAQGPMWFYNEFFKAWKSGDQNPHLQGMTNLSYDEKVALTASGVVGKNLTEFFERWGMTLSGTVKTKLAAYDKETRAVWYLSDQSRRDRLAGKTAAAGTITASAAIKKDTDNTIQVTIDASQVTGTLQGFEIIRNGKPIAFVTDIKNPYYEDVVGSANHRTYTYQVVAYDILGNQVGEAAKTDMVRIAYDKTINPSNYEMTRSGDTVTITFTNGAVSASGLKLTGQNLPSSGEYTITVEDESGPKTARKGDFQQNLAVDDKDSFLTYFQKPGAAADDTRIWTYDAKKITITGIPASVLDENILIVSYAGDDISFLEGGTVGCLSQDYKYGDGADEVIKAGTLVIAGNYRGDPRFNTIAIEGRFTKTTADDTAEPTEEIRMLDGYALLFAEIPEDGAVSDISDGFFLFVPNVQREAELQGLEDGIHCDGVNLLPSEIRAILYRTDDPNSAESKRTTAETLWINSPGGEDLPTIVLKGE